jgi:hypothetical protein
MAKKVLRHVTGSCKPAGMTPVKSVMANDAPNPNARSGDKGVTVRKAVIPASMTPVRARTFDSVKPAGMTPVPTAKQGSAPVQPSQPPAKKK